MPLIDYRATWSDHNPNSAGVVCAVDVKGNAGLKLGAFAEHVRTGNHRAFKYVIYNRRIASRGGAWRTYHGNNPHTDHVHISVGVGPDGRSTGPYDDTSPWGLLEDDDMSWDETWEKLHLPGQRTSARGALRWVHKHVSDGVGREEKILANQTAVLAGQAAILAAVTGQDTVDAVREELERHRGEIDEALTQATAERAAILQLIAQVGSGERDAADVVDEIGRRLASGDQPA